MKKLKHIIQLIGIGFGLWTGLAIADTEPAKPILSTAVEAEKIILYQNPDEKSAKVSTLTVNQPVIPIFRQDKWTKLADPSNGNVGWVQNEILKKWDIPYIKTVTQANVSDTGKSYKIIQSMGFSSQDDKQLDNKQIDTLMQQWQIQRQEAEHLFGQLLQQNAQLLNEIAKAFQDNDNFIPLGQALHVEPPVNNSSSPASPPPIPTTNAKPEK